MYYSLSELDFFFLFILALLTYFIIAYIVYKVFLMQRVEKASKKTTHDKHTDTSTCKCNPSLIS